MSHTPVYGFKCYLARTKYGTRLVFFEPHGEPARHYLQSRSGVGYLGVGVWVSCERCAEPDPKYSGESYASLLARMLVEHNNFRVELSPSAPPTEPKANSPGFGFRVGGDMHCRLFTRDPIKPPPRKKGEHK